MAPGVFLKSYDLQTTVQILDAARTKALKDEDA